jgi:hypothetical protein
MEKKFFHFPSITMVVGPSGCGKSTALSHFLNFACRESSTQLQKVEKVLIVGASLTSVDNRPHYAMTRMSQLFPRAAANNEIHYLHAQIFNGTTISKIQEILNPPSQEKQLKDLEDNEAGGDEPRLKRIKCTDNDDEIGKLSKNDYESLFGKGEQSLDNKTLLNRPPCLLLVEDMEMHAASRHGKKDDNVDEFTLMRGFLGHRVHHYNMAVIICKVTLSGTGGKFWVEQSRQFLVPLYGVVPFNAISPIFQAKSVRKLPNREMEKDYLNYVRDAHANGYSFLLWTTSQMMDIRQSEEELNHLSRPYCG